MRAAHREGAMVESVQMRSAMRDGDEEDAWVEHDGEVVDQIDLGIERELDPVQVGDEATADEHARQCSDDPDDDALQHEDAEDRRIGGAHGFQDRDLSLLFE